VANDDYDTTGLNASTLVNILHNDIDPIGLGLNVSIIGNPRNGTVILNEDGSLIYTPAFNFAGTDSIMYEICDKGTPSMCDQAKVYITIFAIRESILEIYNLVTPNGDGINDFWYLDGIDLYPDNEVLIFNRWGDQVRVFQGYNNSNKNWDGTNEKGENLPDGVYFYIIKIKDLKTFTGWVYLRGNGNN
jgi:gliding motility-associated-like protein